MKNLTVLTGRSQLATRWMRGRSVVCLAELSVEDVKDIFLFGTMITGFLLIGLGATPFYRKIVETAAAVKSPLRMSDMIDAVGRAGGAQTVTLQRVEDRKSVV